MVSVNLMLVSRKSSCQGLSWMFSIIIIIIYFFLGEADFSVNYLKSQS